jgi:hypothetical protein
MQGKQHECHGTVTYPEGGGVWRVGGGAGRAPAGGGGGGGAPTEPQTPPGTPLLPKDGYSRWSKHVVGCSDYNIINLHVCIFTCCLFLIRTLNYVLPF